MKKGWSRNVWIDALVIAMLSSGMGGGVLSDILLVERPAILEFGRSLCERVKLDEVKSEEVELQERC